MRNNIGLEAISGMKSHLLYSFLGTGEGYLFMQLNSGYHFMLTLFATRWHTSLFYNFSRFI